MEETKHARLTYHIAMICMYACMYPYLPCTGSHDPEWWILTRISTLSLPVFKPCQIPKHLESEPPIHLLLLSQNKPPYMHRDKQLQFIRTKKKLSKESDWLNGPAMLTQLLNYLGQNKSQLIRTFATTTHPGGPTSLWHKTAHSVITCRERSSTCSALYILAEVKIAVWYHAEPKTG